LLFLSFIKFHFGFLPLGLQLLDQSPFRLVNFEK